MHNALNFQLVSTEWTLDRQAKGFLKDLLVKNTAIDGSFRQKKKREKIITKEIIGLPVKQYFSNNRYNRKWKATLT